MATALHPASAAAEPSWKHGVSYFGEFKYPPDFEHYDYVNPNAPKGGTLVLATDDNWNSFTPYLAKGNVPPGVQHLFSSQPFFYDGLFSASDDEIGSFYCNLCKEVMVSDDFTWVRFRLRQEARWHDGAPITSRDVRFTFEHLANNSGFNLQAAFGMVDSVEIHTDHEFTIHLNDKNGLNAGVIFSLGKIAILPEHYWLEHDNTKTTLTPPLGSGPYRVKEFKQSRYLIYERVPNYWGRNIGPHRGRHNFDIFRYEFYRDSTVAREAFRKGLIDYTMEGDPRYWYEGYDIPASDKGWLIKRKHTYQFYVGLLEGLVINQRRKHLQDIKVREALVLAFNYDWYHRVINQDIFIKPYSYFAPANFSAEGLPSEAELALLGPFRDGLPERLFTEPLQRPISSGRGHNRSALLKARNLLREAGWAIRDGVLTNADGEELTLSFVIQTAGQKRIILPYVDELSRLGFVPQIRMVESAQFVNLMRNFEFDFRFGQLGVAQPPGVEIVSYWDSKNAQLPNTRNLTGIESAAADEMVIRLMGARSKKELIASGKALDRVLLWNFGIIPLRAVEGPSVVYWDKFGRPPFDAEIRTSFPAAWWYDEKKAARIELIN
jgi:microcin C transport system substrate-binding protein